MTPAAQSSRTERRTLPLAAGRRLVLAGLLLAGCAAGAADFGTGLTAQPMAPRSQPGGATMFTRLSSADTGIVTENRYDDPKMWGEHYQELAYGAMGTGLAIGDYDSDGRPDLFVVSKTGQCRLFRNLGGWKFEDVTARAGLTKSDGMLDQGWQWMKGLVGSGETTQVEPTEFWRQGATFVDVNNDGRLDLYICRFNAPNLLYINQGDGTFKEEAAARGLAVSDASGMAAFCDYDRDGWLDVYIQTSMLDATNHPAGQRDHLFHNRGDGTFEEVSAQAGISGESMGHSVTWWDYDQDGWPDIYVANDYAVPDVLYHNNRDGTFTNTLNQVLPRTPYYSMGSDLGDVNNDGLVDLFVADMAASTVAKDLRGMAGSRARAQLEVTDPKEAPQLMHSALYLNTGRGVMQEAAELAGLAATDWTWSVRWEDLDNDGRLDLQVTNGMIREYHNADLLDRIMALENPGDSRRLMKSMPAYGERNLAFRNLGDLKFAEEGKAWGLDQVGVSFGAVFGDLDGDGDLDLVYANYETGVTVMRNDSVQGHRAIIALHGTVSNRFGIGALVKIKTASGVQVRPLVLARGYLSSSEPVAHFGLGADAKIDELTVEWPSGHRQRFADLPVDTRFTITEPTGPADRGTVPVLPAGEFTEVGTSLGLGWRVEDQPEAGREVQPLVPFRFDRRGPALAVGDVNGDNQDDVIVGGSAQTPARILIRQADRYVAVGSLPPGVLDDGPVLLFDANGDGKVDLLQTRAGTGRPAGSPDFQPVLYLNSGSGFAPAPAGMLPALSLSIGAAVAGDFDGDGRLDLFLGARLLPGQYPVSPRSVLLLNRGDHFEDVTDKFAPGLGEAGLVSSALCTDVDQDGYPDLLVACEWGGVRYFHNDAGHGFTERSQAAGFAAAGTGWWTSLACADFNGDGRLDYVAGNVGLNTPYQADPTHPALLYLGHFRDGGAPLLIEAVSEEGVLHPRRSRNELGTMLPLVPRRFAKNDLYAVTPLADIVGPDRLAAARKFAATELRSGVFLSQPDGSYRFEPLPQIAQIAPAQGIVAGDFDGDGHADIYLVQNSYAPVPSIGRFAGGLSQLLRGDGHGRFTPVTPLESGLVVRGDAKALAVLDFNQDGWPDFLVSRNADTLQAWRNSPVASRHSFQVRLKGRAGNPRALGARITVIMRDGSRQVAEVQAGSGYYSQSTSACFFGWTEANPPQTVRINWPGGPSVENTLPVPPAGLMDFSAP